MSDSKKPSSQKLGRVSMALAGLVIVFLIFLVLNYVASIGSFRVDLTENNIFTLSDGTKKSSAVSTPRSCSATTSAPTC